MRVNYKIRNSIAYLLLSILFISSLVSVIQYATIATVTTLILVTVFYFWANIDIWGEEYAR